MAVYRRRLTSRTVCAVLVGTFGLACLGFVLGGANGSLATLIGSAWMLPLLYLWSRPATLVSPDGLKLLDLFGFGLVYTWQEIQGCRVVTQQNRYGQRWRFLELELGQSRVQKLPGMGSDIEATCAALNAERYRRVFGMAPPTLGESQTPSFEPAAGPSRADLGRAAVLLVVAVVLIAWAFGQGALQARLTGDGILAPGTVVDKEPATHGKVTECPLDYAFVDPRSGTRVSGRDTTCSTVYDNAHVGDVIPIRYAPDDPTLNRIDQPSPQNLYFGFGAVFGWAHLLPGAMGIARAAVVWRRSRGPRRP